MAAAVPQMSVPHRDTRDVRLAWACFVASPVFFVLAFVVGEGMSALLGYDGIGPAPVGVGVLSVVAALVVFSIPPPRWPCGSPAVPMRGVTTGRRCRPSCWP